MPGTSGNKETPVAVETILPYDVIRNQHGRLEVINRVDRRRCRHHVHLNNDCYDRGTTVVKVTSE